VSRLNAKTRSKKKASAPDFYQVDAGIVSAAKTQTFPSGHPPHPMPPVFSSFRERVPMAVASLPNPFRRAPRAGGCAWVRYPRAA